MPIKSYKNKRGAKKKLQSLRKKRPLHSTAGEESQERSVAAEVFDIALQEHDREAQDQAQDHQVQDEDDDDDDEDDDDDDDDDDDSPPQVVEDQDDELKTFRRVMSPFTDHLESKEGGEKPQDYSKLAVDRLWLFLNRSFIRSKGIRLDPTEADAWILTLIESEFTQISRTLDDMALHRGLKANTIKSYLTSSYIPFFSWYRLFSNKVPQPSQDAYERLTVILKSLVANFRKAAKVTRRLETTTDEELVATMQWPRGGIPELQEAYFQSLPNILCHFDEGVVGYRHSDDFYRLFMEQLMFGKIPPSPHIHLLLLILLLLHIIHRQASTSSPHRVAPEASIN